MAAAATVYALFAFDIQQDPELPLIDSWLEPDDARVVAKALLMALVFIVVYLIVAVAWRSLLHAAPGRIKGPLGFELDWTPEDAKDLREVDERQQEDVDRLTRLVSDLARAVKRLERGK
jgi:hypothetical protein